jgi:hypothetical protein
MSENYAEKEPIPRQQTGPEKSQRTGCSTSLETPFRQSLGQLSHPTNRPRPFHQPCQPLGRDPSRADRSACETAHDRGGRIRITAQLDDLFDRSSEIIRMTQPTIERYWHVS